MARYKLTIEYDGTPYCGWQRQDGAWSVQQALEDAIKKLSGEEVRLIAAGRTDAGVHAKGQVAHVDFKKEWCLKTIRDGVNAHLKMAGQAIAILSAEEVAEEFHARFDAKKRHYIYKILNRSAPAILDKDRVWWVPVPLDVDAMHEAAQSLLGKHDFTTFRASMCQAKSPVRSLERLDVCQENGYITIYACARSFLHNQIRSFVGSLKEVGSGRWSKKDLEYALHAKDRRYCGMVAPASGLYFLCVTY